MGQKLNIVQGLLFAMFLMFPLHGYAIPKNTETLFAEHASVVRHLHQRTVLSPYLWYVSSNRKARLQRELAAAKEQHSYLQTTIQQTSQRWGKLFQLWRTIEYHRSYQNPYAPPQIHTLPPSWAVTQTLIPWTMHLIPNMQQAHELNRKIADLTSHIAFYDNQRNIWELKIKELRSRVTLEHRLFERGFSDTNPPSTEWASLKQQLKDMNRNLDDQNMSIRDSIPLLALPVMASGEDPLYIQSCTARLGGNGVCFKAVSGEPIAAVSSGKIEYTKDHTLIIRSEDAQYRYENVGMCLRNPGDTVPIGEVVARALQGTDSVVFVGKMGEAEVFLPLSLEAFVPAER